MSEIEQVSRDSFFAELILPLRRANMRRNVHYLEFRRETDSYWSKPVSRTGGLERLSPDARDGPAFLERLRLHWIAQGDRNLPKLVPYLVALHREIVAPGPVQTLEEAPLSDFVYPLF